MKKHIMIFLLCTALITLSGCQTAIIENPFPSEISATVSPDETLFQTLAITPTATIFQSATPVLSPTAFMETPQVTASVLASSTPAPTLNPTRTPKPTVTPTARPTKEASISPTPKPKSTPKPTTTPEPSSVTPMSSAYKNAVLSGVNYVRTHNGDYSADAIDHLDSALSAKAQKHAEEMAAKGEIFHSSWGPESVSCGDLGNGENAGVQSAVHAAGLLDSEITRIGVGAARSADGTIYLCVDGGK